MVLASANSHALLLGNSTHLQYIIADELISNMLCCYKFNGIRVWGWGWGVDVIIVFGLNNERFAAEKKISQKMRWGVGWLLI